MLYLENGYLIRIDLDGYISASYKQIMMNDEEEPILMQFTGLKDKNGKEIYEGDIVKNKSELYKVKFACGAFGVINIENDMDASPFCSGGKWEKWLKEIEVIGNIYENPELLTNLT